MYQETPQKLQLSDTTFAPCIKNISLTHFRSYEQVEFSCSSRPVILTGENGVGKTNILEALSLFTIGRGLRRANISDIGYRQNNESTFTPWAICVDLESAEGMVRIGIGSDSIGKSRQLRIDGIMCKGFDQLMTLMPQIWLTPDMDRLFMDSATGRRRFLDRFSAYLNIAHAKALTTYEKSMRERNRLLQEEHYDERWLKGLESTMANTAIQITEIRLNAVNALSNGLEHIKHPHFPKADISLQCDISIDLQTFSPIEVQEKFQSTLYKNRALDAAAKRCLKGVHRSDIIIHHREKDMPAANCSTGEQKALLLGLILAQAHILKVETKVVPMLLLDEVTAHLDMTRRNALFETINTLGSQAWITGVDAHIFSSFSKNATHLQVVNGKVVPIDII